jgi:hypothetical protein
MQTHHDAMMRTTVDLPPDLHSVVHSLASSERCSLNKMVVELIRRGLEAQAPSAVGAAAPSVSLATGLPLVHFPRPVSIEDVRALEDEA